MRLWMHALNVQPTASLLLSFFTKILLIILFAKILIENFSSNQKLTLLYYILGYIVASIYDVILTSKSLKKKK